MKYIVLLGLLLGAFFVHGANPAFSDFNTNQFSTTGNKIAIKPGALVTNIVSSNLTAGVVINPTDGNAITNLNGTNIVGNVTAALSVRGTITNQFIPPFKAPFSTNYTVTAADSVLALIGTNQPITLENGTNGLTPGRWVCFIMSSTTGFGSATITNANGVQTVLGASTLSQTITNLQSLTLIWDGSNWR